MTRTNKINKKLENKYKKIKKKIDCSKYIETCKAECCGIVPIPLDIFEKHKEKIGNYKILPSPIVDVVIPVNNFTGKCAFLDENCKCAIYEHRPGVCKLQGNIMEMPCPYRS